MEPKPIKLPKETIDALLNRASMFIMPISESIKPIINSIDKEYGDCLRYEYILDGHISIRSYEEFFKEWSPLQIGDEFYVQEEFGITGMMKHILYKFGCPKDYSDSWIEASQMTYEQSRLKDLVVVNVEIKRVQGLTVYEKESICILERNEVVSFNDWIKKQKINYEENPYVFLITAEKKK